jgi:thiol-disulfide isomerase/thioredoxin
MSITYIELQDLDFDNKKIVPKPNAKMIDNKLLIIFVMATVWCGHCKRVHPIAEQLAKDTQNDNKVMICFADTTGKRQTEKDLAGKVNGFFPDCKGFPSIYCYYDGKYVSTFEGRERSLVEFKKFIDENKQKLSLA